jgi:hypothetical protein
VLHSKKGLKNKKEWATDGDNRGANRTERSVCCIQEKKYGCDECDALPDMMTERSKCVAFKKERHNF